MTPTEVLPALQTLALGLTALRRSDLGTGGLEGGRREAENTYGLPEGAPLAAVLTHWFERQKKAVLAAFPAAHVAPLPESVPSLTDWDHPMALACTPHLSAVWDESGKGVMLRLGLDPGEFRVTSPHLRHAIEAAALDFCRATNRTTTKQLGDQLDRLRGELVAGLVDEGESDRELTKRVSRVFENATGSRAATIARTESSRAYHAAQAEAARESGVVAGLELLLSVAACPLRRKVATEAKRVRLGQAFAVIGHNPVYSEVRYPPLHPSCQCTAIEVLSPAYGGPEDPEFRPTLVQPKADDDYRPPEGVPEAQPQPGKGKPVHHPAKPAEKPVGDEAFAPPEIKVAPDRPLEPVHRPGEAPELPPNIPLPPEPGPKPKAKNAKPKPKQPKPDAFPADPEALTVVKQLGGSTGAELVVDPATGRKFVRKRGANPDHLREEGYADAAYRALGVDVPESRVYETPRGPVKLAEYHEGRTLGELTRVDPAKAAAATADLRKGFVADCLLGNWDVIGTGFDNVLVTAEGATLRIDNGGSLRFRAQGARKGPTQWSGTVGELDSMRSAAANAFAAKVFGALTDDEVKAQVKAVLRKKAALLKALPADLHDTVNARLGFLRSVADAKPPKPVGKFKPLPADAFKPVDTSPAALEAWSNKHFGGWANTLTAAEKKAVRQYTGSGYYAMNTALRRATPVEGTELGKTIATLQKALKKSTLAEGIVVRRGIGSLEDMGLSRGQVAPGVLVSDPAFVSTTVAPKATFGSGAKFEIRLPAGTPGAFVNAAGSYSSHPSELEFLIPAGQGNFRVVEHKTVSGVDHVVLQWVKL
jgi:ADP-ribosyltransferase exoenzyme